MLFHRISFCLSVAALLTCAGCGRHRSDLAKSDPFLNSAPPSASVAENSRTGVLQPAKPDKADAGAKTAATHETINRASASRFEEDGVPSRPSGRDTAASRSASGTPTYAAKPTPPVQKLPGTKPLAQTAFHPGESPDFGDDEPEMKPLYERHKASGSKKPDVELVASSGPAEGDEAAPFPDSNASKSKDAPAARTTNASRIAAAASNPFEEEDTAPAAASEKHPLTSPAAEPVATQEGDASDADHESAAEPKAATVSSSKPTDSPALSDDADPFADNPFSESALKSTASTTAGTKRDADASEWAEVATDKPEPTRTVAHKPVGGSPSKSRPTTADYDDEDPFAALRQAGHQKSTASRPAAKPEASTAVKTNDEANPFAGLEPAAAGSTQAKAATTGRKAEGADESKSGPAPARTASVGRKSAPVDPFADEEATPKAASRPQTPIAAKPATPVARDIEDGPRPSVRSVKTLDAEVEEVSPAPEEEPEGRVTLEDTISRTSYEFESRPPKKRAPASGAVAAKPNGWKPRSATTAPEMPDATKK